MKTVLLSTLGLLVAPSAFAIPLDYPIYVEETGEDFQTTLDQVLQSAKDLCAEHDDEFAYSCVLMPERSFEIRTVLKDVETLSSRRSVYETTVKGQFTCLCNMVW